MLSNAVGIVVCVHRQIGIFLAIVNERGYGGDSELTDIRHCC